MSDYKVEFNNRDSGDRDSDANDSVRTLARGQAENQSRWADVPTGRRCRVVGNAAAQFSLAAEELVRLAESEQRVDPVETLAAELLPFCDALKLISKRGRRILRPKHHGLSRRPLWMWGVRSTVYRDPFGTVLILGTWNYPLLLVGTQAAQALAAGNEVIIKPAHGCERVTARMIKAFHDAGVPPSALRQIDSSTDAAISTIDQGVDLIVLTGAASTGRKVLAQAAEKITPTIMELSGCDAVIVLPNADISRAVKAVGWALCFNGGATCIGPRRLIVPDFKADEFAEHLAKQLADVPPMIVHPSARNGVADALESALEHGATDRLGVIDITQIRATGRMNPTVLDGVKPDHPIAAADLFAPITSIIRVKDPLEAVEIVNQCPYRLAASIFGLGPTADIIAAQLDVGSITLNDLVMPTGDPRLPFGGRGQSGFGVTRGEEGLLAMSTPRVVSRRRGRFAVHLAPRKPHDAEALLATLQILHAGTWKQRMQGVKRMMQAPKSKSRKHEDVSK